MKEIQPAQADEVNGGTAQSIPQDNANVDPLGTNKPGTPIRPQPLPEPL